MKSDWMSLMPSFSQECWNSTVMICWYKPRWIQQQILEQSQFLNESKYNKNIYKYIIMKGAKTRWLTKFFCHLVYVRSHCIWVQPLPKHFILSLNIITYNYQTLLWYHEALTCSSGCWFPTYLLDPWWLISSPSLNSSMIVNKIT